MGYFYRRVASDPKLLKMESQRDARGRLFVRAIYGNVDFDKLEAFMGRNETLSAPTVSIAIPERAAVLDDFTYPIWTKLAAKAKGDVEPEYKFSGLGGKVPGTWSTEQKTLALQFVVQEV